MITRQTLYQMIDQLPDESLPDARQRLLELQAEHDQFLRFLANAPIDDEPLSDEEIASIAEARAEIARGEGIPWEVVKETLFDDVGGA